MTHPLVAQLLATREQWVELDDGLGVKVRRPPESQFPLLRGGMTTEVIAATVVDWRGFTGATILGAAIGSSDPVAFDAELWRIAAEDRVDWLSKVAAAVIASVTQYIERREADRKN